MVITLIQDYIYGSQLHFQKGKKKKTILVGHTHSTTTQHLFFGHLFEMVNVLMIFYAKFTNPLHDKH